MKTRVITINKTVNGTRRRSVDDLELKSDYEPTVVDDYDVELLETDSQCHLSDKRL